MPEDIQYRPGDLRLTPKELKERKKRAADIKKREKRHSFLQSLKRHLSGEERATRLREAIHGKEFGKLKWHEAREKEEQ